MNARQYIEKRIKEQQKMAVSSTELGKSWREIIIQELEMVLQHLPRETKP